MTRRAVVALAAVALGMGVFVCSSAMADHSGSCDKLTACNDEISDACGPHPSKSCVSNLIDQCKAGSCTCTGEAGLPRCPVTTTSSTTTSSPTSSTTTTIFGTTTTIFGTTTTSSTTTTTTIPPCTFILKWGVLSVPGNGQFNGPFGVATDGSGHVYVADTGNDRIQKFD